MGYAGLLWRGESVSQDFIKNGLATLFLAVSETESGHPPMSIGRCVVALLCMALGLAMLVFAVVVPWMIGVTVDSANTVLEYVSKMPRPISVRAPGSTPVLFPATGKLWSEVS